MNVGTQIRTLRTSKGLTQEDVAFEADMSQSYLTSIETNKQTPSIEMLDRIANALGCELLISIK